MFTLLAAMLPIGAILGLRFKVLVVVFASAICLAVIVAVAAAERWSLSSSLLAAAGALLVLQLGYLIGIGLRALASRMIARIRQPNIPVSTAHRPIH